MKTETTAINIDRGKGDFSYPEAHVRDAGAGLSERTVHYISDVKRTRIGCAIFVCAL